MDIGATITHFRVGVKPGRTGDGAAFGLRALLIATGGMRDTKNSVAMRQDEHGRERHSTRRRIGYILLLHLPGTNPPITIQRIRCFSGGARHTPRPD